MIGDQWCSSCQAVAAYCSTAIQPTRTQRKGTRRYVKKREGVTPTGPHASRPWQLTGPGYKLSTSDKLDTNYKRHGTSPLQATSYGCYAEGDNADVIRGKESGPRAHTPATHGNSDNIVAARSRATLTANLNSASSDIYRLLQAPPTCRHISTKYSIPLKV